MIVLIEQVICLKLMPPMNFFLGEQKAEGEQLRTEKGGSKMKEVANTDVFLL